MNYHGGCARNAGLNQVIGPKAGPRLMGAPGDARQKEMTR